MSAVLDNMSLEELGELALFEQKKISEAKLAIKEIEEEISTRLADEIKSKLPDEEPGTRQLAKLDGFVIGARRRKVVKWDQRSIMENLAAIKDVVQLKASVHERDYAKLESSDVRKTILDRARSVEIKPLEIYVQEKD